VLGNREYSGVMKIEIVDHYVYSGIPMYGNMNFAKIADEFIVRCKRAQRELFQLLYKASINNLDVRLKLFDSLVKSSLVLFSHLGYCLPRKVQSFSMFLLTTNI
jgi:hypothetical protein